MGKKEVKVPYDTIIGAAGMIAGIQFQKQIADALTQCVRENKNVTISISFSSQKKVRK